MTDPGGAPVRETPPSIELALELMRGCLSTFEGHPLDAVYVQHFAIHSAIFRQAVAYLLQALAARPDPAATPPAFYDACPMCGGIEEHGGEEMSQACEAFERVVHWSRTDPPPAWLTKAKAPPPD